MNSLTDKITINNFLDETKDTQHICPSDKIGYLKGKKIKEYHWPVLDSDSSADENNIPIQFGVTGEHTHIEEKNPSAPQRIKWIKATLNKHQKAAVIMYSIPVWIQGI
jgi:hypothetical protein